MSRKLWIVMLCGGIILGISLGFRQSLGLFLPPISTELGIGRNSFSLSMGLMNLLWGMMAPIAGALADRFGAGRLAALGGLLYALGLGILTQSGTSTQLVLGGALLGIALSGVGFSVVLGTVGRLAPPEYRSQALGVASMCGSLGQFLALPYTHVLIQNYGWYVALLVLAITALIMVPLARGIAGKPVHADTGPRQSVGEAFREACSEKGFILLTAGFFVCGFHLAFIGVHLPAYLADKSFEPWVGVAALTAVGFCNIIGSYVCGLIGARFSKKKALAVLYTLRSAFILLFISMPLSETSVILFGALMGFLWLGTVPLTSGLIAQVFGTNHMAMLFGLVFFSHQVGGFFGSWLAGYFYDMFGNYDLMWNVSIALGFISALLHLPISERPLARLSAA